MQNAVEHVVEECIDNQGVVFIVLKKCDNEVEARYWYDFYTLQGRDCCLSTYIYNQKEVN